MSPSSPTPATHTCAQCTSTFVIHPDEEAFLEKMAYTFNGKKIVLPLPVHCPDCRAQIRTCHRNERFLYKTRSAFSGKDTVSLYHEKPLWGEPYAVYTQEEWRSDAWDPLSYGRPFDFNRGFFEQWKELHKAVPRMALISIGNENSNFTTGTGYCKNCYLINSSEYCEDCYYGKLMQSSKSSVDCSYLYNSELCYECFSVYDSWNCHFLAWSTNCQDCVFSAGLKGCKNCCLCTNLDHKEYHFQNEPLSKEEYEQRLASFRGNYERTEQMKSLWKHMMSGMIHKYGNLVNCENCTGDYVENSRNCLDCYDVNESQDCHYVQVGVNVKDNVDCSNMYLKPELCYHTLGTIEAYHCAYCLFVFHSQDLLYCEYCFNCSDCFACSGLTHKKYCIFNAQYSKEEYEELVPRIIEHMKKDGSAPNQSQGSGSGLAMNPSPQASGSWGQYFPPSVSPFGYNESLASEYFPLTEDQARAKGFHWREKDARDYMPQTCAFPTDIKEVQDTITQEVFACESCRRNYRIIPQELAFYRQNLVPIPRHCPDCRYVGRLELRNPRKLWTRKCMKCEAELQTTYGPDRPETIYCEKCYLETIY